LIFQASFGAEGINSRMRVLLQGRKRASDSGKRKIYCLHIQTFLSKVFRVFRSQTAADFLSHTLPPILVSAGQELRDKTVGFQAGRVSVLSQINRPDGLSSAVVISADTVSLLD